MDAPTLELVRDGSRSRSIILLPGYLTEAKGMGANWTKAIDAQGFEGAVFQLRWDSSGKATALRNAVPLLATASGSPPGATLELAVKLRKHWSKVKSRAKAVGADHLPKLIGDVPGQVTIVAHSLGARVAYFSLHGGKLPVRVSRLVICGGAIRGDSSRDWAGVASHLDDGLCNVRNEHDWVLKGLFKLAEGGRSPVGLKRIKAGHPSIHDVNVTGRLPSKVTDHIKSHSSYFKVLGASLEQVEAASSPAEGDDTRKHCRVCGKRIKYGAKFQVTRRFYCKGCGHRTHVACAASVGDEICRACG